VLSDAADLDQVDELRARSDAILVGAQTVRSDNPRLQPSAARQQQRIASGLPASLLKVTVTGTGDLDPASRFFTGDAPLVYAGAAVAAALRARLTAAATIVAVPGPDHVDLSLVLADLAARGVGRLMVEGGARVLHELLAAGLADEFRLAIAPVIVADPAAPRLVTGSLRAGRLGLAGVTEVGRMVVLRYGATATS
jgi:5-amino-6-(5-phosphoribosylamino)uracil reductase